MKKIVFCIIPLVVVLMGCASTGAETGGAATADATAKQLAKDLNASKAKGGTVTLSGRAEIKTGLTVPEGVTLDLTAEGAALELRDGAVLTVNGTVNATGHGDHGKGWVEGSLRIGDGEAVINGSGTIYLKSKGRLLNIGGDRDRRRQLTLDGVTLVGLPDNDHSLVNVSENGALVLKSGAITGNTRTSDDWADGGGVVVHKGTFSMEGGTISGNTAKGSRGASGGGVRIGEEAVFTMSGGEISGNSAGNGGGVDVRKGTFSMENGSISGNTVTVAGGGVCLDEDSTFTMKSGSISGNTAKRGGGVYLGRDNTFTMTGGAISGNTVEEEGGGLNVRDKSAFILSDGTISNNTAGQAGGGVCLGEGVTFTMTGGTISGNHAAAGTGWRGGGGVRLYSRMAAFAKTGGIIYGNDADGNSNTAASGDGHAVGLSENNPGVEKKRDATLGPGDNISLRDLSTNWDR